MAGNRNLISTHTMKPSTPEHIAAVSKAGRHATTSRFVERRLALPFGTVNYVVAGEGKPLLLLHGGYGSWKHWIANIEDLARHARVIALDMPGFGMSDSLPGALSIDGLSTCVAGIMRRLLSEDGDEASAYHVIGFSFGATVASMLAQPQFGKVDRLLLLSPPGIDKITDEVLEIQARASRVASESGLMSGIWITARETMLGNHALINEAVLEIIADGVRRCRVKTRDASRSMNTLATLEPMHGRVRLLFGSMDPFYRSRLDSFIQLCHNALGPSSAAVVHDCSHWIQYEQPTRLLDEAVSHFGWERRFP